MDVAFASNQVEIVKKRFNEYRSDALKFHHTWYETSLELANAVGANECVPRRCGLQKHRANLPSDNAEEFYLRVITIPVLGKQYIETSLVMS